MNDLNADTVSETAKLTDKYEFSHCRALVQFFTGQLDIVEDRIRSHTLPYETCCGQSGRGVGLGRALRCSTVGIIQLMFDFHSLIYQRRYVILVIYVAKQHTGRGSLIIVNSLDNTRTALNGK